MYLVSIQPFIANRLNASIRCSSIVANVEGIFVSGVLLENSSLRSVAKSTEEIEHYSILNRSGAVQAVYTNQKGNSNRFFHFCICTS